MQDDNLEYMEYLLTRATYENWMLSLSAIQMYIYLKDSSILGLKDFYLKEHDLPIDSEIKD